ncbi:hypothetical protein [Sphingobacterium deserti]|uniref:Prealbumin-like fold domain-containing protein n=1 Tax=Sphingobacterium deserti TaxID=1229276 RepID=A0A0B8T0M8_9SPHI|nr:hypothetical protein [Sphingobacterium deserti]KGE14197.1 hypothetical protein DI53_2027 [Sphingobacterium deserti]
MKLRVFFLFSCTLLLLSSCKKTTHVSLVENETHGTLTYHLQDDDGKGIPAVKVYLYDTEAFYQWGERSDKTYVDTMRTNQQGSVYFKDLNPRNYFVVADSVSLNGLRYRTEEYVQVVAGIEKEKSVKISDFAGTLRLKLISHYDYFTALRGLGVIAYPSNTAVQSDNVRTVIANAKLKGVTDAQGIVSIKVPSNVNYDFIVYSLTSNNLGYGYGSFSVRKGELNNIELYTHPM